MHREVPPEDVTIQVWIPRGWTDNGGLAMNTLADDQIDPNSGYGSSASSHLTNHALDATHSHTGVSITTPDRFPQTEHQSRSYSISSHRSTTTTSSNMSCSSLGSEHNVTVRVEGTSIGTGYGTIRNPPRSPLLVLFTRSMGPESKRSIVAITLDKWTDIQMNRCKCLQSPLQCPITALESSRELIDARRFDGDKWDLLPLAASRDGEQRRWYGLTRVSIWFPTPDLRKKFGGESCRCSKETEGELEACHLQGHQGLLGVVRDVYRRLLIQYHRQIDNQVDVVNHLPQG